MMRARPHVPSAEEKELRKVAESQPFPRRRKAANRSGKNGISATSIIFGGLVLLILLLLWISSFSNVIMHNNELFQSDKAANEIHVPNSPAELAQSHKQIQQKHLEAPSIDSIVESLMGLADMPFSELQHVLEGGEDAEAELRQKNPFHLDELQEGKCPWAEGTQLSWLPPQKSLEAPHLYQKELQAKQLRKKNTGGPIAAVYYEHLSKAGGTSFCKLAQANMARRLVPNYYCMPSKPNEPDARVGAWPIDELKEYFQTTTNRLVSNEWEPFNLKYMDEFEFDPNLQLVFVTSLRHPINRLMSAHKFWGILHNPAEKKPTIEQWITRYAQRAKHWTIMNPDFTANVGRFDFATWKFSGGTLPMPESNLHAERYLKSPTPDPALLQAKEDWKEPFETAIRTLSKFDLVIIMEELSKHPQPVTKILGWKDFSQAHVVPSGKVMNNKASSELDSHEYDLLWQANALDMILYYWSMAVYLTRLHCADLLPADDTAII
ncbi:unnamed protein product [Cylindrotheca closterium]|uniref:Uncharacterized protein n=1 Tax=Cylindrotheca closterium TaxID=2856 RepID=A0AAD2GBB3_9STRA|nr:unnamed protein product [Cylindrotheca closterium]